MSKLSPLQRVRTEHGSKAKLAEKVLGFLEPGEGEDRDDFEHRISHLSNAKLLRLWDSRQTITDKHGSRDELVDKVVAAQFSGGNEPYKAKISGFSDPRLLDLARRFRV